MRTGISPEFKTMKAGFNQPINECEVRELFTD